MSSHDALESTTDASTHSDPDDDRLRPPLEEILHQVKRAILLVQRVVIEPVGLTVDKVDITLKTFVEEMRGGGFKLTVPILGDFLGDVSVRSSKTQTISLTLKPVDQIGVFSTDDIEARLSAAIFSVRDAVIGAMEGAPRFGLVEASIELNLVVNDKGEISLLLKGHEENESTHTLKLYLKGPEAPADDVEQPVADGL